MSADSQAVRAMFQGQLLGTVLAMIRDHTGVLRIENVEQAADDSGDYLDWFTVVMHSGNRYRVRVTEETSVTEPVNEALQARVDDIYYRIKADMEKAVRESGVWLAEEQHADLMTNLLDAAMHHVEVLLMEER